jgi:hypothetical protein
MILSDLKLLRDHIDCAIEMAERNVMKDMTPAELLAFRRDFNGADAKIGNFVIWMIKPDARCSTSTTLD